MAQEIKAKSFKESIYSMEGISRKTVEEHLKKESHLNKLGIKVLSLFFIDKVA